MGLYGTPYITKTSNKINVNSIKEVRNQNNSYGNIFSEKHLIIRIYHKQMPAIIRTRLVPVSKSSVGVCVFAMRIKKETISIFKAVFTPNQTQPLLAATAELDCKSLLSPLLPVTAGPLGVSLKRRQEKLLFLHCSGRFGVNAALSIKRLQDVQRFVLVLLAE